MILYAAVVLLFSLDRTAELSECQFHWAENGASASDAASRSAWSMRVASEGAPAKGDKRCLQ